MISFSDLIFVIPNLLSKEECQVLIKKFETSASADFYESSYNTQIDKIQQSTMKVKEIKSDCEEQGLILEKINVALKLWCEHLENFDSFAVSLLKRNLNYPHKVRILKYEEGDSIHPHIDHRDYHYASCTLNLNGDYEGGAFSFFNQKFNVNLKEGDALVFPNNHYYVHEVLPVTKGTRYSVNSFITSIPATKINALTKFWNLDELRSAKDRPFKLT